MKIIKILLFFLLVTINIYSNEYGLFAQEQIYFSGYIVNVKGKKMEVKINDNESIWITTENELSTDNIGLKTSGYYQKLADTYILIDTSK